MLRTFLRKAVKTFKVFADAVLLTFSNRVSSAMAIAVKVFPSPTPALTDLDAEIKIYGDLLVTSGNRDKVQVALKNASKKRLLKLLSQLCDYVNMVAAGDLVILQQSSMDLNKIPEPLHLQAATGLSLKDGDNAGEITLKFTAPDGATGYMYQYTTDELLGEKSWESLPGTTATYTFTGLTKNTTYYIRVVAFGTNQQVVNSIVLNRISQ